ncbi:hypothetical protein R0381_003641 [Jeongeupia wiesaeckerbachi]
MHNAHVLLWLRWQHYWAVLQHRQFAQLVWVTEYNTESRRSEAHHG